MTTLNQSRADFESSLVTWRRAVDAFVADTNETTLRAMVDARNEMIRAHETVSQRAFERARLARAT